MLRHDRRGDGNRERSAEWSAVIPSAPYGLETDFPRIQPAKRRQSGKEKKSVKGKGVSGSYSSAPAPERASCDAQRRSVSALLCSAFALLCSRSPFKRRRSGWEAIPSFPTTSPVVRVLAVGKQEL